MSASSSNSNLIGFAANNSNDFTKALPYGATVITTPESTAFDRGVRPVLQIVLPDKAEAILGFRADPELQGRIEALAAKSTEGQLTAEERAEYEGYVRANKFVAILQRQARQMVGTKS